MKSRILHTKEWMWVGGCMLISFFLHVVTMNQLNGWFCTDTDGYLLHAATFAGYDWSSVASKLTKYYSWGYSLILILPLLLSENILIVSQIVVVINSLLCALIIPLLYSIGKRMNTGVDNKIILLSATITSMYSTYIVESSVALAESLLFFLYTLLIWCMVNYLETNKSYWAVLSGVLCGYLYIVHHRMLGVLIAFILVVTIRYIRKRSWRELLLFIIPIIVLLYVSVGVDNWLEIQEKIADTYTGNTYGSTSKQFFRLFSLRGVLSFAENVIGEFWYCLVGTFSIAGFGLLYVWDRCAEWGTNILKKMNDAEQYIEIHLFAFAATAFTVAISAIFCLQNGEVTSERIDIIFYGRYFESTMSIILFWGLLQLSNIKELRKNMYLVLLLIFGSAVWVHYFVEAIAGKGMNYFSVVAVLFPFSYPNVEFSVMACSVCSLMIALAVFRLLTYKEWRYRGLAYLLIAGGFVYIGYNALYNIREIHEDYGTIANFPVKEEGFLAINEFLADNEIKSVYVYSQDYYEAFSYQLFGVEREIIPVSSTDEIDAEKCQYIVCDENTVKYFDAGEIFSEDGYILVRIRE